jgi:hypothetical protein
VALAARITAMRGVRHGSASFVTERRSLWKLVDAGAKCFRYSVRNVWCWPVWREATLAGASAYVVQCRSV